MTAVVKIDDTDQAIVYNGLWILGGDTQNEYNGCVSSHIPRFWLN